ncbi:hypothetical protein M405DRAFT_824757 [Rhizopogon salebrosus TDB-379]|nr:hypothetical protein M405DRAFT_824757 [Rhizopogon salebrosus TDB-379]
MSGTNQPPAFIADSAEGRLEDSVPATPSSLQDAHVPIASGHSNSQKLFTTGNDADILIVDWDGPNDPQNPKKWVA